MSEIVERVARAIHLQDRTILSAGGETLAVWEQQTRSAQWFYLMLANAAIQAMREPTELMLDAGRMEFTYNGEHRCEALAIWHAMVHAALRE